MPASCRASSIERSAPPARPAGESAYGVRDRRLASCAMQARICRTKSSGDCGMDCAVSRVTGCWTWAGSSKKLSWLHQMCWSRSSNSGRAPPSAMSRHSPTGAPVRARGRTVVERRVSDRTCRGCSPARCCLLPSKRFPNRGCPAATARRQHSVAGCSLSATRPLGGSGQGYRLTPEQMERSKRYEWPGSIRELQNVIERATIVSRGGPLFAGRASSPEVIEIRHHVAGCGTGTPIGSWRRFTAE